jgi:pre-mRNA-splicing factor 18
MEALMRVMAAKKRELAVVKSSATDKYLRRAEVESLLAEAAEKGEEESKREKEEDGASKRRRLDESAAAAAGAEADREEEKEREKQPLLSWSDMRKRLRELGEPITLFGEDPAARMARLQRAELDAATKQEDELGEGHGIRNRFVGGDDEGGKGERDDDGARESRDADSGGDGKAGETGERDAEEEEDESDEDKVVYRFFKSMLQRWEKDLANRPDHIKRTAQGKIATKTMKQCKDYIRPLFKLCKRREVPADIRPNLVEIVRYCRQGEFVRANDAYIRLAIGNAAWPIGVTMVGIHERTGREKINANKQAHVMNNESQRKYLTSVKRLISYAQSVSNVLPSKKVS